jgi:23S rRNA (adenine2503-C2)-methyltransferase
MKLFLDFERQELAALLDPPYRATQIFKSVYHRWISSFEAMTDLPKAARKELAEDWNLLPPRIHRRFDSTDGTRRYLVPLEDGEFAETVFIPEERRNTICISSQVAVLCLHVLFTASSG